MGIGIIVKGEVKQGMWPASSSRYFTPKNNLQYLLDRKLGRPRTSLGKEKVLLLSELEPWSSSP
jgi:hypothetical protein